MEYLIKKDVSMVLVEQGRFFTLGRLALSVNLTEVICTDDDKHAFAPLPLCFLTLKSNHNLQL